jgi:hypothetical protein
LTGRRRTEVIELTAGDISVEGDIAFYSYRGKAGNVGAGSCPASRLRGAVRHLCDIGSRLRRWSPAPALAGRSG